METLFIGQEKISFETLDSTNAYLKQLCNEKVRAEGLTITAEYQTLGRGQIGNRWDSPKGLNLLFSVLLRPNFLSPDRQFYLNMSVCLAIFDALNEFCLGFQIKWPNDILFDGKKVGGILIENSISKNRIENSIIGVGINVNQSNFSEQRGRTSLYNIMGNEVDRNFLLHLVAKKMETKYLKLKQGTQGLFSDYYSALYGYLQAVDTEIDGEKVPTVIKGVEPNGTLITEVRGQKRKFDFKEIKFLFS